MPPVRFLVEEAFDLSGRGGILATGRLVSGAVGPGTVLRREDTGQRMHVLGLDLLCPRPSGSDRVSLLVDRKDASALDAGAVLTGEGPA